MRSLQQQKQNYFNYFTARSKNKRLALLDVTLQGLQELIQRRSGGSSRSLPGVRFRTRVKNAALSHEDKNQ